MFKIHDDKVYFVAETPLIALTCCFQQHLIGETLI